MTEQHQLSAKQRLHESLELRRKMEDPRVEAMVNDVRAMRTEMKGINQICNFSVGNSREANEIANLVFERTDKMEERLDAVAENLDIIFARLDAIDERMENMAQWAKTKGKT